jgi:hypothetical protein
MTDLRDFESLEYILASSPALQLDDNIEGCLKEGTVSF